MEIRILHSKSEMLSTYEVLKEFYPSLTFEQYQNELDIMIPHNYSQVAVFENDDCIGLTGYWIGSKLWCGKYLELDNVVVSTKSRSNGVGKIIFDHIQEIAIKENCTMMALDSYTDNFKAHKFFYREGFIPRGFHFIKILDRSKIR